MKSLRLLLCALPLALTGCSTMSAVNWSAAYPWNWFGSSMEVTEQGVGKLTAQRRSMNRRSAMRWRELSPAQRHENGQRQYRALL
jgi:hypothetical protein